MYMLSSKYWKCHKKQFLMLFSITASSSLLLFIAMCMVRANIVSKYEDSLDYNGNYNYLIIEPSQEQITELKKENCFSQLESVYNEGVFYNKNDSTKTYQLASVSKSGENMYHLRCQKGRYPKSSSEIAVTETICQKFEVAPILGESITLMDSDTGKQKTYTICGILKDVERIWTSNGPALYPDAFIHPTGTSKIIFALGIENEELLPDTYLTNEKINFAHESGKSLTDSFYLNSNEASYKDTMEKVENAQIQDFESAVLIPIFLIVLGILISITLIYSIISLSSERRKSLAIYCLLGMESGRTKRLYITELLIICAFSWAIGSTIGWLLYCSVGAILERILKKEICMAYEANEIIRAVTFSPLGITTAVVICSILVSIYIVICTWKKVEPIEAVKERISNRKMKKRKWKKSLSLKTILHVPSWDNIISITIILIIMSTSFFFAVYFYAKYKSDVSVYEEQVKEAGIGNYDFLMRKDMEKCSATMLLTNRWNTGISKENIQKLKQEPSVENMKYCIGMPEINIIAKEKQPLLEYSLKEYEDHYFDGMEELYQKGNEICGYSQQDTDFMYNVSMVALDENTISNITEDINIIDGAIDEVALRSGKEVLLIVTDKEESVYDVGDEVLFTDAVIDKDDPAYSFLFTDTDIPDNSGVPFTYHVQQEDGSLLSCEAREYGHRKDFSAKVGAVVSLKGGKDNFYYVNSKWGNNKIQFLSSTNALKVWELPHENYTKLGISLNRIGRSTHFLKTWYEVQNSCEDVVIKSVYDIKKDIYNEELKYGLVLVSLLGAILVLGLLSIYQCINMQLLNARDEIGIVRLLGTKRHSIIKVYCMRYIKYIILSLPFSWIPFILFVLKEGYLKNKAQEILDQLDVTGYISPECIIYDETIDTGWLYHLRGGRYDFLQQPYILIFTLTVVILSCIFLKFVYLSLKKKVSNEILDDMKTEE